MRLENIRHSVAEMFSVTEMLTVALHASKVPRAPACARPNMV